MDACLARPLSLVQIQFRIEPVGAFGADAVSKVRRGMTGDVVFNLLPAAVVVVADSLAGSADGQQAAEGADFTLGTLQLGDQGL